MLGNSFISTNHMPQMLAALTSAEVVCHTRGGARLSEHLNPNTKLGARTQAALREERWNYVVLQEMSHGPITSPKSFFSSVEQLCSQIRKNGAIGRRCPFSAAAGRKAEPHRPDRHLKLVKLPLK